jgi:hypothetical protein
MQLRMVIALTLLMGCRSSTSNEAPVDVVGRYELLSLNNSPLPVYLPLDQPPRLTLLADTVWLRADSTFRQVRVQYVVGPPVTVAFSGRFSVSGTTISLKDSVTQIVTQGTVGVSQVQFPGGMRGPAIYQRSCIGSDC